MPSPPATRHPRRSWRDPRLVTGVALVALSVLLGARLLAGADDTVRVWAAGSRLTAGQPLTAADLVRRDVRFGSQRDADRYLSAQAAPPAGAVLSRDVGPGELVPRAALSDAPAAPLTEVPLSVAAEQVPSTVGVGSLVDVWVAPDPTATGGRPAPDAAATLVFRKVPVVAAPRVTDTLAPSSTRQVIIGVRSAEADELPTSLAQLSAGTVLLTRQH